MIKRCLIAVGLLLGCSGALTAADRSGAIADMRKNITEITALLEAGNIAFQPTTLSSNTLYALVRALDPGAMLTTFQEAERYQKEEQGCFYDVGLKMAQNGPEPKILEVANKTPAQAAGLRAGMSILKIDDQSTEGLTPPELNKLLRGPQDSQVTLTFRSAEQSATGAVCVLRRTALQMPAIEPLELWPQQIAYLKINGFYEDAGAQISAALQGLQSTNSTGIILDLRGANGTNLEAVAQVAGLFHRLSPSELSVRDGSDLVLRTYPINNEKLIDLPVMLLVDKDTRAGAETLALALQDCHGVMAIGAPTGGDNGLREPIAWANGQALYIATRSIVLGKNNYRGQGVKPAILVTQAAPQLKPGEPLEDNGLFSGLSDQEKQNRALLVRVGNDYVLRRAVDIIMGLKALDLHNL